MRAKGKPASFHLPGAPCWGRAWEPQTSTASAAVSGEDSRRPEGPTRPEPSVRELNKAGRDAAGSAQDELAAGTFWKEEEPARAVRERTQRSAGLRRGTHGVCTVNRPSKGTSGKSESRGAGGGADRPASGSWLRLRL